MTNEQNERWHQALDWLEVAGDICAIVCYLFIIGLMLDIILDATGIL